MNRIVRTLLGLLTIGLVALTSCKKEPEKPQNEGTTYANVSISIQTDMRAGGDHDFGRSIKWNGKDAIKTISVYIVDNATISSGDYDESKFTITKATDKTNISITPKEAILTTPGEKSVYVLINAPQKIKDYLNKAVTPFAFKKAYAAAVNVITAQEAAKTELNGTDPEDVIMMTNAKECTLTVAEGVTEAEALATQNPKNRAPVQVRRAVARVLLTTTSDTYWVNDKNRKRIGVIKDITYAVAQGEKSFYLMQMRDNNNIIKTPAYDFVPEKDPAHPDQLTATSYAMMDKYYDYSDLQTKDRVATVAINLEQNVLSVGAQALKQSVFMFEASHKYGDLDNTDFRRANTPYVLVRAKFTPDKFEDDAADNKYTEGSTFYMGENGRFYIKKENVVDETKGGIKDQRYYTYENAKVIYYAFLNPDKPGKTINAPAYRNNIYYIRITGFKTIGMNWNPLFPEVPGTKPSNNPDPRPEGEVLPPPIKPGDTNSLKEAYMVVDVTVIPWKIHEHNIDLPV